MNGLIHIGNSDITIKEYSGQRVVTFKDIDAVHGRPDGTANKRFLDNKKRFVKDEDYFIISNSEIRKSHIFPISDNDFTDKTLITEQGYLMLVKSFTDDLAWDVQRQLVNTYFKAKKETIDRKNLSSNLQIVYAMLDAQAKQELEQKRQAEQINKVEMTVTTMRDIFTEPIGDWQNDINKRVREIAMKSGTPYNEMWGKLYGELEVTAHCSLKRLAENKRKRMQKAGNTKQAIAKGTSKLAIIHDNTRLKLIFEDIVKKYAMAYVGVEKVEV